MKKILVSILLLPAVSIFAQTAQPAQLASAPKVLTAAESDPVKMGWMQGSPPSPEKTIRFADGSMYQFPQIRWSFSNIRQLVPTTNISHGASAPSFLPRAERSDIDQLTFQPLGRNESITWAESLAANYTDAIVVLHKGKIVYERYFGITKADTPHIANSVTKSVFGTLGAMLIAEGKLDRNAKVVTYIPELKDSAFADATVGQVFDMTTGIQFSENYANQEAEIWKYARAGSILPRPPGYTGPQSFYTYAKTVKKEGEHGQAFAYKTVNSDVAGWLIRRASGMGVGDFLATRIWQKLGVEHDAYMSVDTESTEFAGGGLNMTARDMARFGEMIRLDGAFNGQQIISPEVVKDIKRGGDKALFSKANYTLLPGWSYHNMWWKTGDDHGAFSARGIYGQAIYIDPKAEMVIARFASHPVAANAANDPTSLPAYRALAEYLMK